MPFAIHFVAVLMRFGIIILIHLPVLGYSHGFLCDLRLLVFADAIPVCGHVLITEDLANLL